LLTRATDAAAEHERAVDVVTRAAADTEAARAAAEASAATDREVARDQSDRLGSRIVELEELLRTRTQPAPAVMPAPIEELALPPNLEPEPMTQLAEPVDSAPAPPPSSDLLRSLRSELADVNTVDAEARRSLLSDLSDLADASGPPADS
jgi:hypothetical protein